jgi:hypothetical protein
MVFVTGDANMLVLKGNPVRRAVITRQPMRARPCRGADAIHEIASVNTAKSNPLKDNDFSHPDKASMGIPGSAPPDVMTSIRRLLAVVDSPGRRALRRELLP